jgi:hypothetical protein
MLGGIKGTLERMFIISIVQLTWSASKVPIWFMFCAPIIVSGIVGEVAEFYS